MGMKPDIRMRWVERLRSGLFKQRQSSLYGKDSAGNDSYCCLGVLCTIAEEDGVIKRSDWKDGSLLPSSVMEWAGISENDPVIDTPSGTKAANANDGGAKFPEIATAIARSM